MSLRDPAGRVVVPWCHLSKPGVKQSLIIKRLPRASALAITSGESMLSSNGIKAIFFDFDGTLRHSVPTGGDVQ